MNAPDIVHGLPPLKDPKLFRQQCYIDGGWCAADDGGTIAVTNPASGETLGTVPSAGAAETRRAIQAANAAWPAWRAKTARERAAILRKWSELMMANQEDLGAADDGRAGQAADRIARRDRLRGIVHRVVRRRRAPHLRRHDPRPPGRQADRRAEGADRRVGRDHAVELPGRDDHAQGRRRAGRRLPDGAEARERDTLFRARPGRVGRARRRTRRACSASSRARPPSSAAK